MNIFTFLFVEASYTYNTGVRSRPISVGGCKSKIKILYPTARIFFKKTSFNQFSSQSLQLTFNAYALP